MALLYLKSTVYTIYCAKCLKSDEICTDDVLDLAALTISTP